MSDKYHGPYEGRLIEIDERIADLNEHITMWSRAGGGRMAMQAVSEINSLKEEKDRILNGTQEKIDVIQDKIEELRLLKQQCKIINFVKKINLNKEIKKYELEKSSIIKR